MVGVPGLIETPEDIDLVLDPGIRTFVLIPIFFVVFLRSLLSYYVARLTREKHEVKKKDRIQHANSVSRSKRTRANSKWIPMQSFLQRRRYLIGTALKPIVVEQTQPGEQNMDDVGNMMSMMKGNTASYISNIGFMFWVNSFFSGFLLIRLPFNVTETLRPLVQRDIALQAFDCSYVSSLSWYFMTYFGLSGLSRILLGQQNTDDPDMKLMREEMGGMNPMMGPMGAPGANPMMGSQAYNPNDMFKAEANELKILKHDWYLKDAEKKLLQRWKDY